MDRYCLGIRKTHFISIKICSVKYAATLINSQSDMQWIILTEDFGIWTICVPTIFNCSSVNVSLHVTWKINF